MWEYLCCLLIARLLIFVQAKQRTIQCLLGVKDVGKSHLVFAVADSFGVAVGRADMVRDMLS